MYSLNFRWARIAKCADARKLRERHGGEIQTIGRTELRVAERVGDLITVDHKIVNEEQESRLHHRYVVVVQALPTQWIQSHPRKTRSAPETQRNLRNVLCPEENPRSLFI